MIKFIRILTVYVGFFVVLGTLSVILLPQTLTLLLIPIALIGPVLPILMIERKYSKKRQLAEEIEMQSKAEAEEFVGQIEADKRLIRAAVEKHQAPLKRNLKKAIKINDYGALITDERHSVVDEFLASVSIVPSAMPLVLVVIYVESLLEAEDELTKEEVGFNPNALPSGGHTFEEWVADSLKLFGWEARVTQGSGDQGVDVIASKEGKTVAIQCKLYSQPVGNKAVQEAFSGSTYYGADYAAVITNAGFTSSAKDLAISTKVILLSPEDIPTFHL